MRKICAITGYRSDYTKLKSVLKSIKNHPELDLQLLVFGAHLSGDHGNSIKDIEADGYKISYKCTTNIDGDHPLTMSKSIGLAIMELAGAYERLNPDAVLIVGDRYEILAAAVAASIGNIPVAHIQGGEVSGTIDETIRHTITKLSHIHFPSTEISKKRILTMGENPAYVFNVGCPAIDHMKQVRYVERSQLKKMSGLSRLNIDLEEPYFILAQHPVTTEYDQAGKQMEITLGALQEIGIQTVLIYPNPDAGSSEMVRAFRGHQDQCGKSSIVRSAHKNISFDSYLNLLKYSSCLVGNSSSGIREAHFFNVPVVNIGTRQAGRERSPNIVDVTYLKDNIKEGIEEAQKLKGNCSKEIYGKGVAGELVADLLSRIKLNGVVQKSLC